MRRILIAFVIGSFSVVGLAAQQPQQPQQPPAPPVVATPRPMPAQAARPAQVSPPATSRPAVRPAQTARPTVAPAAPVPPTPVAAQTAPTPRKLPTQNVRMDVTITDTFGTGSTKKTVTMLVADGRAGQIRSSMQIPVILSPVSAPSSGTATPQSYSYTSISLNVDSIPEVLPNGGIFISMTVQYTPDSPQEPGGSRRPGSLNETLAVVLTDGKQTLISQSADPQGDRKVTLEVTATIVK